MQKGYIFKRKPRIIIRLDVSQEYLSFFQRNISAQNYWSWQIRVEVGNVQWKYTHTSKEGFSCWQSILTWGLRERLKVFPGKHALNEIPIATTPTAKKYCNLWITITINVVELEENRGWRKLRYIIWLSGHFSIILNHSETNIVINEVIVHFGTILCKYLVQYRCVNIML